MKEPAAAMYAPVLLALSLCMHGVAVGEPIGVELDLDETVGNGPDTVFTQVGAELAVDVWITGVTPSGEGVLAFTILLCNAGGTLLFEEMQYTLSPWWVPETFVDSTCVTIRAASFSEVEWLPFQVGTAFYRVIGEPGVGGLFIEPEGSSYVSGIVAIRDFGYLVGACVLSEATSTSWSTWGAVKRLFQ